MRRLSIYLFVLFLLGNFQVGLTQSNSIKPGQGPFKENKDHQIDRQKLQSRLLYAKTIFHDSISRALNIVEVNLFEAINHGFRYEEALAYTILGDFNKELTNYKLALSNYNKAVTIYKEINNQNALLNVYSHSGDSEWALKNRVKALGFWQNAEQIAQSINNTPALIQLKLKMAKHYVETKDYDKAKAYYNSVLNLSTDIKDEFNEIKATIGLGEIEELTGETEKAETLFNTAWDKADQIQSSELSNSSLNSLSNLYENQQNIEQSIQVQQRARDYNEKAGDVRSVVQNSTDLANNYAQIGEEEEAIEVLNETSTFSEQVGNTPEKRNYYKTMTDIYEKQGETQKAAESRTVYNELIDSFQLLETQKRELISAKNDLINMTENKILLLEKDREINEKTIALLQQEQALKNETIKRQKTITYILISGLIIICIMAFFIYRNNKQKQISNQLLTLKSLRNQMNPHFIFNSLNSVNGFIAKEDGRSANKYLSEFSKLMREVLEYSQNDFISLAKEVEILKLYMNLEHFRFKEHFDYTIDYDKDIDLDKYQIPPMLLQPFIENAIWHGLRYKEGKGNLDLIITEKSDMVEIKIIDDGIGREKSKSFKTPNQEKMKSTGIKNVKDRLEIIRKVFQKELTITINNLNPETKEGTEVKVELFI